MVECSALRMLSFINNYAINFTVDIVKVKYITYNALVPLGFFSLGDTFPMEIDKHQAMFGRYNRSIGE